MADDTERKSVAAAAQAALWTLSNGRCYYPDCLEPVVKLARPGVYRKNVQIAHIHGIKPGSPRHKQMPLEERDGFGNLMLMCTAHHSEIDNKTDGERRYPAELLRTWKTKHEAAHGKALEALGPINLDVLGDALAQAFVPPVDRLNAIADQLERTGAENKQAVNQLREVASMLTDIPLSTDSDTARRLAIVAGVFESLDLNRVARELGSSAEFFSSSTFRDYMTRLRSASERDW
jgi:hypothetical protein